MSVTALNESAREHNLASSEEIINEARNGRMFILVDDENRENEGDLIVPGQMATPEKVNFMAQHGRGLICLAMTKSSINALQIPMMSQANGTRHETAFTVSIEARDGVTTGISAADRARTIAVAIDNASGPDDLVTPGHVFPLMARDGGVLVRAGHTEAAVDVARLAGLNPSGVICEIMNDDGTMARLDDLVPFAEKHKLKIGTIRDLIAYRMRNDQLVLRQDESPFLSRWGGDWKAISFTCPEVPGESLALVKGAVDNGQPVLVRMHVVDVFSDALAGPGPREGILQSAMTAIADEGVGVVVLLRRDASISNILGTKAISGAEDQGNPRDYGVGAQILAELGIEDMILLSNSKYTPVALSGYGLNIVEVRPLAAINQDLSED